MRHMKRIRINKEDEMIEETETYLDELYLMVAATLFEAQSNGDIRPFEGTKRTLLSLIENKGQENLQRETWSLVA